MPNLGQFFFELNVIDWVKKYAQGIFLTQIFLYPCRTANAKIQREDGYFYGKINDQIFKNNRKEYKDG